MLLAQRSIAFVVMLLCATMLSAQAPANPIDVKVAKYDDLSDFIAANKGKVVLVDFWALTCDPCKQAFPHTVQLGKDLAAKGLVVVSVSTDSLAADRAKTQGWVLTFLKNQKAAIPNFILDEPEQVLREKLRLESIPCFYVFNREGKWKQFVGDSLKRDDSFRYPEVEAYINACLREPAPK